MMGPVWFEATKTLEEERSCTGEETLEEAFKAIKDKVTKSVFASAHFVMLEGNHYVVMAGPQSFVTVKVVTDVCTVQGRLTTAMDILKLAKVLEIDPENLVLKQNP